MSAGHRRRGLLAGALLAAALLCGCQTRKVDACDDSRAKDLACVNLQLDGQLGDLDRLFILGSSDQTWAGYSDVMPGNTFQLPVAVALALPPDFSGTVRVQVQAILGGQDVGAGTATVSGIQRKEHRQVDLTLQRVVPDLGPPRDLGGRD